jgi:hypothetical protein
VQIAYLAAQAKKTPQNCPERSWEAPLKLIYAFTRKTLK